MAFSPNPADLAALERLDQAILQLLAAKSNGIWGQELDEQFILKAGKYKPLVFAKNGYPPTINASFALIDQATRATPASKIYNPEVAPQAFCVHRDAAISAIPKQSIVRAHIFLNAVYFSDNSCRLLSRVEKVQVLEEAPQPQHGEFDFM